MKIMRDLLAAGAVLLPLCGIAGAAEPQDEQAGAPEIPERSRAVCRAQGFNAGGGESGPDGTVPEPWLPVTFTGKTIKVWGREFQFGYTPLPVQIRSQGQDLLAGNAWIDLDPMPSAWKLVNAARPDDTHIVIEFEGLYKRTGRKIRAITEVWFNGMMRLDVEFPAGMEVNCYALVFPVRREVAQYLHCGPPPAGGAGSFRRVKPCKDDLPVHPQLFLCNDEVGFGWFDGMPSGWPLARPERALEVIPLDDQVLLRVNYVDAPVRLEEARTYRTGLEPVPERPRR